jgi:hypothetical protein
MPATGEGISVSALSVATSSSGWSASMRSPGAFSHLVMLASVYRAGGSTMGVPVFCDEVI